MHKHNDASTSVWFAIGIVVVGAIALYITFVPIITTALRHIVTLP